MQLILLMMDTKRSSIQSDIYQMSYWHI